MWLQIEFPDVSEAPMHDQKDKRRNSTLQNSSGILNRLRTSAFYSAGEPNAMTKKGRLYEAINALSASRNTELV